MPSLLAELRTLADLVLPATCPGCRARGEPICENCARRLASASPFPTRPVPAPRGLPEVWALDWYGGVLRSVILRYKERGRRVAGPVLGQLLSEVVAAAAPEGRAVALLPVPSTAAAIRSRYGDQLRPVVATALGALRARGLRATAAQPLRALPRADSAGLTASERFAAASRGYAIRPRGLAAVTSALEAGAIPVLVDDIITTGSTLAAVAQRLREAGVPVARAAVVAATRKVTARI